MSNLSHAATMPEPSNSSLSSQQWTKFREDYTNARSNTKSSLPLTDDACSKEIRRKIMRRLTLMDRCVEGLTHHRNRKLGVLSAAVPLRELSEPETWSVSLPNIGTGTSPTSPQIDKVDSVQSYRTLRTALSKAWLENYGLSIFDKPRRLKESARINGETMNSLTRRVWTLASWQGYVQGMSFDGDLDALNPRPNPGTMNFYLASQGLLPGGMTDPNLDLQGRALIELSRAQDQLTKAEDQLFLPPRATPTLSEPDLASMTL